MNPTLPLFEFDVNPAIESAEVKVRAARVPRKKVPAAKQLDIFIDDPLGALAMLELADRASRDVEQALTERPDLLPVDVDAAARLKESVDFARFMRASGMTTEAVRGTLEDFMPNAAEALETLEAIEADIGAKYPTLPAAYDAPVAAATPARGKKAVNVEIVEEESEDSDVDADDEMDADIYAGEREPESDSDSEATVKRVKSSADEMSSSALGLLLKTIRGEAYAPADEAAEVQLASRIRAGDAAARNELVNRNMRFLVMSAKRFMYTGRPLDVLVSAGTLGIIKAAEKFDPAKGRFTTVASWWIRQSIQRALEVDSIMKTPAYLPAKESRLRKQAAAAETPEERDRITAEANEVGKEIKARRAQHVSIDGGQDDDSDGGGLHNLFAAEGEGPDELMEKRQLITQLVRAAESLEDDRSSDIFLLRLGLHPDHVGEPQTLAEVSERFDISRERVRQVYCEAARDVANAVCIWAKGAQNLPEGFRKGLMNPGRG